MRRRINEILVICVFVIFILVISAHLFSSNKVFEINRIGSDRENYTFFKIASAAVDENRNIYVGDLGGLFVAKYSWDGRFLRRTGRRGQGPGDFAHIGHMLYAGGKIYINDMRNSRIAILDKDLTVKGYIKTRRIIRGVFFVLDDGSILCSSATDPGEKEGRVEVLNPQGRSVRRFFTRTQFGEITGHKDELQWAVEQWTSKLIIGYDPLRAWILIGFNYPRNPMEFFLYSVSGKRLLRIEHHADSRYRFPEFLLSYPVKYPSDPFPFMNVTSIFAHGTSFIVFCRGYISTGKKQQVEKDMGLVFNQDGRLQNTIMLPEKVDFFVCTEDGCLIGRGTDNSDVPQVIIYRLVNNENQVKCP